jgi:hypothetical protein
MSLCRTFTKHNVNFTNLEGKTIQRKGVTLLLDGGYPSAKIFQTSGDWETLEEAQYCAHLESVRKDVECTFGMLKSRFRILKYGMRIANREVINCVIATCAGLHNEILAHKMDGSDIFTFENEEKNYSNMDSDLMYKKSNIQGAAYVNESASCLHKKKDRGFVQKMVQTIKSADNGEIDAETFESRRQVLVNHFTVMNKGRASSK